MIKLIKREHQLFEETKISLERYKYFQIKIYILIKYFSHIRQLHCFFDVEYPKLDREVKNIVAAHKMLKDLDKDEENVLDIKLKEKSDQVTIK